MAWLGGWETAAVAAERYGNSSALSGWLPTTWRRWRTPSAMTDNVPADAGPAEVVTPRSFGELIPIRLPGFAPMRVVPFCVPFCC